MKMHNRAHFLGIGLSIGLFLPHTSTFLMLVNPLLCLFLYYISRKHRPTFNNNIGKIKTVATFFVFIVAISLIARFALSTGSSESVKFLMTGLNLIILFLCFPFTSQDKIPAGYFYFAILFILFSQLVYALHIPALQQFFDTMYPVQGDKTTMYFNYMRRNVSLGNLFDFRLSGLYRNPNQAARFVTLITALFIVTNRSKTLKEILIFLGLAFFSVLLTGSRTGLFIQTLLLLSVVYKNRMIAKNQRLLIYFLIFLLLLYLVLSSSDLSGIRGLQVGEGFSNSANLKWYVLLDYLSQPNSVYHILFGYGDVSLFEPSDIETMDNFDSEYGEIIYTYGFFGFLILLVFYITCFSRFDRSKKPFFIILFWMVSSTILMSYRMSFAFLFSLSYVLTFNENGLYDANNIIAFKRK